MELKDQTRTRKAACVHVFVWRKVVGYQHPTEFCHPRLTGCVQSGASCLSQTSKKIMAAESLSLSSPLSSHWWDTQIPVYRVEVTHLVM